jgi:ribosomal protein S18 acetylase RimI-like enzyme
MSVSDSPPQGPVQEHHARAALTADVDQLASLMVEFYAESGFVLGRAAAARTFAALLATPELGAIWILESGGAPAGFVVLTVAFSMEYGGLRGFVDDLFVRAPLRRRGLGTIALDAVKRACVERGVRALLVETASSNDAALRLYQRAGLVDSGHLLLSLPLAAATHHD